MIDPRLKQAFSGVKQDIEALNSRILVLEKGLDAIMEKLDNLLKRKNEKTSENPKFDDFKPSNPEIDVSTGNVGVYSINHSTSNQSFTKQSLNHSLSTQSLKEELENRFNNLTNKEFLTFLTVYQLQDELNKGITYDDVASKMGLSTGCIRGYTSSIIKKGLPLVRNKVNNRITVLTIDPNFKELGLKQRLFNIFYRQDPEQTSLFQK